MTYSDALRVFIQRWEGGPFLSPHWDALGRVWDIAWGHVLRAGEEHRSITLAEAEMLFDWDLQMFDDGVSVLVTRPVAQCQHDSLVSLSYNVGLDIDVDTKAEGLGDSTLLRYVNAGDFDAAADEFPKWNKAGGQAVLGLSKRRAAERAMFAHGDYTGQP